MDFFGKSNQFGIIPDIFGIVKIPKNYGLSENQFEAFYSHIKLVVAYYRGINYLDSIYKKLVFSPFRYKKFTQGTNKIHLIQLFM